MSALVLRPLAEHEHGMPTTLSNCCFCIGMSQIAPQTTNCACGPYNTGKPFIV